MRTAWGVIATGIVVAAMAGVVAAGNSKPAKHDKEAKKLAAECVISATTVDSYTVMVPQDLADFCVATAVAVVNADYTPPGP